MAGLPMEIKDLSEMMNDLDIDESDEVDVSIAGKAKGKKKHKKKKATSKCTESQAGEFGFSADRSRLINVGHHVVKGRTLVASTALPAGTLFFSEQAVATVSHTNELCLQCGKVVVTPVTDADLPSDMFCSVQCQTRVHSCDLRFKYLHLLSQNIAQIATTYCCDKDLLHMVFRLLALSLFPPTDASTLSEALCEDVDNVITATLKGVNTLEAHLEQQPAPWVAAVTAGIQATIDILVTDSGLAGLLSAHTSFAGSASDSSGTVLNYALFLACIVNVNAYGIVDYQSTSAHSMGFGLFPAVGLCVNHACLPNSYYSYNARNGCMAYRTIKDIAAGEELTVSYTDIFLDTPQRRTALHEKRFFLCQCTRCAGYDLAEKTALSIHTTLSASEGTAGSKKKNKQEEEARRAELSPFYQPVHGPTADDALLEDWADEPAADKKKTAKGKSKSAKGNTEPSVALSAAKADTSVVNNAKILLEASDLKNVVADAMLSGLCCEACGKAGVVVVVGAAGEIEPTAAACIVCTALVDVKAAHMSLERCRSQWRVCQDTVQYAVTGAAGSALVEKFLQEADPEYAAYTACTTLQSSGTATSVAAGANTAQAVALERRRKAKCPVQLHAQHATLSEAYLLLYDHLWVQYQLAEQSGTESGTVALLSKVLYCLRRVLRSKKALLQPTLHPEVSATQYLLASVLQTAMRHSSKGTAVLKELKKECLDLLNEVIAARVNTFGEDHDLTRKAKDLLQQISV